MEASVSAHATIHPAASRSAAAAAPMTAVAAIWSTTSAPATSAALTLFTHSSPKLNPRYGASEAPNWNEIQKKNGRQNAKEELTFSG